jgi:hypothetical protein
MRKIKFKAYGSSAVFGSFAPGDVLRCSDDAARHFVEEAKAAEYAADAPKAADEVPAAPQRPAAKRARRANGD